MTWIGDAPLLAIAGFDAWSPLRDVILLLLGAMLCGAVAERLRQSVIVGYLVAGALVGPNVLGWISKQQEIFAIAELGVALLLFTIGLELTPRRLLELGAPALATGIAQVVITALIGWGAALLLGVGAQEALVIGMMVAMSSTACVLRMLKDRAELDGIHGRAALAVLLVQDVAVVPMLLTVSAMAGQRPVSEVAVALGFSLMLAGGLVAVMYGVSQYVTPRLMRQSAWQRNRDLPILLAIVLALGCAWGAYQLELSPALGAFAGGVLLAASPFATQIRADVRPLSTVLVTLFFASIGMFGDPQWLLMNLPLVAGVVLALVVGKAVLIAALARAFGQPLRYAVAAGLCLAQIGEFSFVLATIAQTPQEGAALMSPDTFRVMVSATIFSLLLTPYLVANAPRVGGWVASVFEAGVALVPGDETDQRANTESVLIIGFGPAGQRVAEGLLARRMSGIAVIDLNQKNVELANSYGLRGMWGDATQTDVLEHAGVLRIGVVVVALPDHDATRQLIVLIRDLSPDTRVIVRCRYHVRHWDLLAAGAHEVVDEEDRVGRELAREVIRALPAESRSPGDA